MQTNHLENLQAIKQAKYQEYQEAARNVVEEQMRYITDEFKAIIPNEPKRITFEFSWEWNDEDGTDPHVSSVSVYDVNGDYIELEEYTIKKRSKYSDYVYEYNLEEYIRDEIYEHFDLRELLDAFDTRYELEVTL